MRNLAGARHINIAHGLYPREPLPEAALDRLAAHLRATATLAEGRAYAGGLTKFEPREMERLLVPRPEALARDEATRTIRSSTRSGPATGGRGRGWPWPGSPTSA